MIVFYNYTENESNSVKDDWHNDMYAHTNLASIARGYNLYMQGVKQVAIYS